MAEIYIYANSDFCLNIIIALFILNVKKRNG